MVWFLDSMLILEIKILIELFILFFKEVIMEQNITTLQQWIDESDNIVFFGGAGVSTESGIPDFRSVDGL